MNYRHLIAYLNLNLDRGVYMKAINIKNSKITSTKVTSSSFISIYSLNSKSSTLDFISANISLSGIFNSNIRFLNSCNITFESNFSANHIQFSNETDTLNNFYMQTNIVKDLQELNINVSDNIRLYINAKATSKSITNIYCTNNFNNPLYIHTDINLQKNFVKINLYPKNIPNLYISNYLYSLDFIETSNLSLYIYPNAYIYNFLNFSTTSLASLSAPLNIIAKLNELTDTTLPISSVFCKSTGTTLKVPNFKELDDFKSINLIINKETHPLLIK